MPSAADARRAALVADWPGPSQAGHVLGCSAQYIKILHATGRLRGVRTRLGLLIDPASLEVERVRRSEGRQEEPA